LPQYNWFLLSATPRACRTTSTRHYEFHGRHTENARGLKRVNRVHFGMSAVSPLHPHVVSAAMSGPGPEAALFADLSKIEQANFAKPVIKFLILSRGWRAKMLTHEEFASLLSIGTPSTYRCPAVIPPEHRARLIELGYVVDIQGKLRMTTPGRNCLAAGTYSSPTQAPFGDGKFHNLRFGSLE
jgi:hypothetical protein